MFKAIADSAAAADGGSLALFAERLDGTVETFVINRSLASRGTADHNRVASTLRALSPADCLAAADALEALLPATPRVHPVADFVMTLRAQGRAGEGGAVSPSPEPPPPPRRPRPSP